MHQSFQPDPKPGLELKFQPWQIVCLEHNHTRLFAEVVQMADRRQICWVRPLAMIEEELDWTENTLLINPSKIHDLRQSSDLLLPAALFRNALDTEVIPLMSQWPELLDSQSERDERSQAQLRELIKSICLAHPELF